jgi:hypothetical protein
MWCVSPTPLRKAESVVSELVNLREQCLTGTSQVVWVKQTCADVACGGSTVGDATVGPTHHSRPVRFVQAPLSALESVTAAPASSAWLEYVAYH